MLSQLAHRVFGPLHGYRVRATLDYHGLTGRSADRTIVVASRHGISDATLTNWVRTLASAGRRLPLSVALATEILRRSAAGEDHLGRTRAAKTFGFAPPRRPARPTTGKIPTPGPTNAERSAAHIAGRALAAAGPQDIEGLRAGASGPAEPDTESSLGPMNWPPRCGPWAPKPMTTADGTRRPISPSRAGIEPWPSTSATAH